MALSQNLETKDIRTKDGNIRFGHIHNDQGKSSIMLQGQGGLEFISLEQVGEREGWIWSRCRGRYQITCGDNIKKDDVAFYLNASGADGFSKGNIEIVTKGTFKVQAENIQLIATGNNNSNGLITLKSNEKIELDSKQIIHHIDLNQEYIEDFYRSEGFINGQILPPKKDGYSCYSTSQQFLYIPKSISKENLKEIKRILV